jgi:hypothetical protein
MSKPTGMLNVEPSKKQNAIVFAFVGICIETLVIESSSFGN